MTADRAIPSEQQIVEWFHSLSNWGRWGPDDELGTLNLITPAKRVQAAALVREGVVVSCARPITYESLPSGPSGAGSMATRHFMLKSGDAEPPHRIGRANAGDAF